MLRSSEEFPFLTLYTWRMGNSDPGLVMLTPDDEASTVHRVVSGVRPPRASASVLPPPATRGQTVVRPTPPTGAAKGAAGHLAAVST